MEPIDTTPTDDIGKLFKEHIDDLRPYIFDLSKKNIDFVNSLAVSSATIASFSLLALQIGISKISVNLSFLILGFIILLLNPLLAFWINRVWIDVEERPIKQSLHALKIEEEFFLISKDDPELQQPKNIKRWRELIDELKRDISRSKEERHFREKITKWLGRAIYFNLFLFSVGLFLLILGFIS